MKYIFTFLYSNFYLIYRITKIIIFLKTVYYHNFYVMFLKYIIHHLL